jgi:hypothetical protein
MYEAAIAAPGFGTISNRCRQQAVDGREPVHIDLVRTTLL